MHRVMNNKQYLYYYIQNKIYNNVKYNIQYYMYTLFVTGCLYIKYK